VRLKIIINNICHYPVPHYISSPITTERVIGGGDQDKLTSLFKRTTRGREIMEEYIRIDVLGKVEKTHRAILNKK